jgi:tRNA pseudouridine55 synthase
VTGAPRPAAWPSGILIVAKPAGLTSHDVVARVRKVAHTRRVGHAGTLDPMATGVLVIGVEKATRLLGYLMLTEKVYEATIRLGQSTTTDDAEGEETGGAPANGVSGEALTREIARLTGPIMQVPPGVSAIKVNGERAYKLTRAGEAPELAARPVTVHEFMITDLRRAGDFLDVGARIRCSSGTYIRALARDLGAALGTGGHLTALCRTAVGPYTLDQAVSLDELESKDDQDERQRLTPLAQAAAAAFPTLDLAADEARRLAQGARLPLSLVTPSRISEQSADEHRVSEHSGSSRGASENGGPGPGVPEPGTPLAAFAPDGTLVALVTVDSGSLRSLAVFATVLWATPS